jgi:putative nucleotidyltransferase with HDIG domain
MNFRWLLKPIASTLKTLLGWVERGQDESHLRMESSSLLAREVHVPTPLVTAGAAAVLFFVLLPETGLVPQKVWALVGLLGFLVFFFVAYFRFDLPQFVHDDEAVFLTGLSVVLGVLFIEGGLRVQGFPAFSIPLGAVAIVVTLLLHIRLALLINVVLAIVAGVLNKFSFDTTMVMFFSSTAAMLASNKIRTRGDVWRVGFHVAWVTALAIYGLGLFDGWTFKYTILRIRWAAPLNGLLCAVVPLGLLPVLEAFFSRVTPITLLEVGDFNRPLLRRLMMEAPGTYHHTLLVAAMAEQAAEAIGANSLLCRVGMYYHDIGKLVHPEYFIENQTMRRTAKDKPEHHDKLEPSMSSMIIMSHVKEGVALARSNHVPQEIMRFIPEHHGTSLIKYFYMRALEDNEEDLPPAEIFRYPGPKPHSKETVIAMLADSVEAASRTVEEPTYERLLALVEKVVNSKFTDGQFDNAPVTLADLRKIINSFAHSLSAIYHVRIEYPELPADQEAPASRKLPPHQSQTG